MILELRPVEEALKDALVFFKINQIENPVQLWFLDQEISRKYNFTWQQEDCFESIIRGFHQQIFIENRDEEIEIVYPKKGDVKKDKDGNPVMVHPAILDDDGEFIFNDDGSKKVDKSKTEMIVYDEPKLFFDKPGEGRITRYIPEHLKNSNTAISQYYLEVSKWRKDGLADGSRNLKEIIVFFNDLSVFDTEKLPKEWATVFSKTKHVLNNILKQNLEVIDLERTD